MDPGSTPPLLSPPTLELKNDRESNGSMVFDSSPLQEQAKIPKEFIWLRSERPDTIGELEAPIVDLAGFFERERDEALTRHAAELIKDTCTRHGFFQVINHGVHPSLIGDALKCMDEFFKLPLGHKLRAWRKAGCMWGYAVAHADRFSSKLPCKETLSFGYQDGTEPFVNYFTSIFGKDFEKMGRAYERYCRAMKELSLATMELLEVSLGVDRGNYREFFKDGSCIMRCNNYPPCPEPGLTLGTGPHCDPTSLTILLQDQVGWLEVFTDTKWQCISPIRGALVINIGDTFMALSNGKYKSYLHRAVVNKHRPRRSLAFFLCPTVDKVIRPPDVLLQVDTQRKYMDFTWSEMLEFTQKHYRADTETLQSFSQWLQERKE